MLRPGKKSKESLNSPCSDHGDAEESNLRRKMCGGMASIVNIIQIKLSSYLMALRPWSFSASLTPVVLGSIFAYKSTGQFDFLMFLLTCMTTLSVHGAGNLVNTYYDYMRGIDSGDISEDRTLVDGLLTVSELVNLGALLYTIGCVGFGILQYLSAASMEYVAFVYFGGISSSFLYTGGIGLKYIALGDVIIVISFGPVCVLFAYLIQTAHLSWQPLVYAIPLVLNTEAILHSNNARDVESDSTSGIVTLAILVGPTASYLLFCVLLFVPYIIYFVMALHCSVWIALPILTVMSAFKLERMYRAKHLQSLPKAVARVNFFMGLLYACGLMLASKDNLLWAE